MRKQTIIPASMIFYLVVMVSGVSAQTGTILREYWTGISGSSVSNLTQNSNFPSNPTGRTFETKFQAPINWGDNYGTRMMGYIYPPVSGNYTFWISSDDQSELWLSTNDNPANKILIAKVLSYTGSLEWTRLPEQKSSTIYLVAGNKYYIEALHKEAGGDDNIAVGWQLPDNTFERPIPGSRLEPWQVDGEQYSTWSRSTKIYFDTKASGNTITAKVSSFPILIRLNSLNFDFTQAKNDGSDVRFCGTNGVHFPYEIERWDATNQLAEVWVSVDTIYPDNNTQYILMFWGKTNATSRSNGTSVFSSVQSYKGVWHLNNVLNTTPPQTPDASYNNIGALQGTSTGFLSDGLSGQGFQLNGSNQYISTMNSFCNINTFTASLWFKTTSTSGGRLFGWGTAQTGESGQYDRHIWLDNAGKVHFGVYCGGGQILSTTSAYNNGAWHHVVARISSAGMFLYVDGLLKDSKTGVTAAENTTGYWRIGFDKLYGWSPTPTSNYYCGLIDEVEIAHTEISDNKIKLMYANQKPGQTLVIFDASNLVLAPTNFTATAINNSIMLSWTDNANNENGYKIYRSEGSSNPVLISTTAANIQSFTDVVSGCNKTFSYTIKAFNAISESQTIGLSAPVSIIPCLPSGLQATVTSPSVITITWTGTAPQYVLNGSQDGAPMAEIYRGSAATFTHNGLTCHTTWSYQVMAVNNAGNSGWTQTISATTGYCPINAPSNLVADNSIPLTIKLTWNDNSDNEDGFKLYRKEGTTGQFQEIHVFLPNIVTYTDQNLKCNTTYTYYVVAFDLYSNNSGNSNNVTTSTLYCGADKPTSDLILISGMTVDSSANPINGSKLASVKFYPSISATIPVYEEAFENVIIKNGFFAITPGLTGNVADIIRNYNTLFYDVIIDGRSVFGNTFQPLTASPYSIKNSFNLYGVGSPIGLYAGPVGASYVDTQNQDLYMKFGTTANDWVKVSQ